MFGIALVGVGEVDEGKAVTGTMEIYMCTNFASISHWQVYLDGLLAGPTTDVESIAAVVYDEFVDHHLVQPKVHRRLQCHVYEVTKRDPVIANSV